MARSPERRRHTLPQLWPVHPKNENEKAASGRNKEALECFPPSCTSDKCQAVYVPWGRFPGVPTGSACGGRPRSPSHGSGGAWGAYSLHRKQDLWKLLPSHWTSSAKYTVFWHTPHFLPPPQFGILNLRTEMGINFSGRWKHRLPMTGKPQQSLRRERWPAGPGRALPRLARHIPPRPYAGASYPSGINRYSLGAHCLLGLVLGAPKETDEHQDTGSTKQATQHKNEPSTPCLDMDEPHKH